ncbi:MAG TPA: hypothetical protein PKL89_03680 [Coprothermobacter proteolyticus]|uniref:hypothetical protein n=1 Tax=Bacteria TaxID=2 RepID=UPI000D308AB7|nr:hypothetical protein [Coprothermobacter proteolyticus]NLG95632.1 hypothetical protein [Acetomicrobium flavidum]HOA64930.1 hypothetical protein [Coprothermobacter proteolyticus]HPO84111.1 hypothetical protein [Coprothermobacter proteolyticus]
MKKLIGVISVTLLLLLFLCGCQNVSLSQQWNTARTASVTIQELNFGETFLDRNLQITCEGLYGSAKNKYTDTRNVIISVKVTNTTDFDTRITATQFAATFNGYLVDYVSKSNYVNDTQDTATNLIELLPLEANIPPRSSVLGNISFDVKASNYTRESFENIKIFYRGYDGQTKAIWTISPENINWEAVEKMDSEKGN